MKFWKVLMEDNGMELADTYLINAILRNLPDECTEFRSYLEPLLENAVDYGTVSLDGLDEHLRSSEPQFQDKETKTEIERKVTATPKALPNSHAFDVEHIDSRLRQIRLEFCVCVKDYLGRSYFWRRLLKEHGKTFSDSDFLEIMISGLSGEYREIGAHYNMLRSTPAFEEEMLDEFASDLRVLERDVARRLGILEQDIARFESSPSLNSMRLFLEELRHRRDPANVMQLNWKIRTYFGFILASLLLSATDIEFETILGEPISEMMQPASIAPCFWGTAAICQRLYLHFRLKDVFIHVVGWVFLILCTAGFNHFHPDFPFSWLSLMFKVALPMVVYHGLVAEQARGRIKGYREAKKY